MERNVFKCIIVSLCLTAVSSSYLFPSSQNSLEKPKEVPELSLVTSVSSDIDTETISKITPLSNSANQSNNETIEMRSSRKRSKDRRYVPSYQSPQYDNCPPLASSCPSCMLFSSPLPEDICSFPIVMRVLMLSPPSTDRYGRVCGKLGLLAGLVDTDIKQYRRLLRFSVPESCNCILPASQQYILLSKPSKFTKDGSLFSKISLSEEVIILPVDRYTESVTLKPLEECKSKYQPGIYRPESPEYIEQPIQPRNYRKKITPAPAQPSDLYLTPIPPYPASYPPPDPYPYVLPPDLPPYVPPSPTFYAPLSPPMPITYKLPSFLPVVTNCLEEESCPKCFQAGEVNLEQKYCTSDFAYIALVSFPDLTKAKGDYSNPYDTGSCLKLRTTILHDVSKGQDTQLLSIQLNLLLSRQCSCFPQLKGFAIVLLLGRYTNPPIYEANPQLKKEFTIVYIPAPSEISIPNCDLYPAPTPYVPPVQDLQEYSIPNCPYGIEASCPSCSPSTDQAFMEQYCTAKTALVAEIQGSGSYAILAPKLPSVQITTSEDQYNHKSILIKVTKSSPPSCIEGSLKVLQVYKPPQDPYTLPSILPFTVLSDCLLECGLLSSPPGTKLLLYSSKDIMLLPSGGIQLTKDIYLAPLGAYENIPSCSALLPLPPEPEIYNPVIYEPSPPPQKLPDYPTVYSVIASMVVNPEISPANVYDTKATPPPVSPKEYEMSYTEAPKPYIATPPQYITSSLPPSYKTVPPYEAVPSVSYKTAPPPLYITSSPPPYSAPPKPPPTAPPYVSSPPLSYASAPPPIPYAASPPPLPYATAPPPLPYTPSPPPYTAPPLLPYKTTPSPSYTAASPPYTPSAPPPYKTVPLPPYTTSPPLTYKTAPPPPYTAPPPIPYATSPAPLYKVPSPSPYTAPPPYKATTKPPYAVDSPALYTTAPAPSPYAPVPTTPYKTVSKEPIPATQPPYVSVPPSPAIPPPPVNIPPSKILVPYTSPYALAEFQPCIENDFSCPECAYSLPPNFRDAYCMADTALLVTVGLNYTTNKEYEDPKQLSFKPAGSPHIIIQYGVYGPGLDVTVSPYTPLDPTAKQNAVASQLCLKEKVRALFDVTRGRSPNKLDLDIDVFAPALCPDCPIALQSPTYAIILSKKQLYLNGAIQLTNRFNFYPLPKARFSLPDCYSDPDSTLVPPYTLTTVNKYQVPAYPAGKQVSCDNPAPCVKCPDPPVYPYFEIPCDQKLALMVEILETSAGKPGAPTLEVSVYQKKFDYYETYIVALDIKDSLPIPDTSEPYKNEKSCKYAKVKVIQDLSPYPLVLPGTVLTVLAASDCDCGIFSMSQGFGILLAPEYNKDTTITIGPATAIVLPFGYSSISLCSEIAPYNSAPPTYPPPVPPTYPPPVPPTYPSPVPPTYPPKGSPKPIQTTPAYPPPVTPAQPVIKSPTLPPPVEVDINYGIFPVPTPKLSCNENEKCLICGNSADINANPDVYCSSVLVLLIRISKIQKDAEGKCVSGAAISMYEVTASKPAQKAVLNIFFTLPQKCLCPQLIVDKFALLMVHKSIPVTNPLVLDLDSFFHIYSVPKGRLTLPFCDVSPLVPRSKDLDEIFVDPVDNELTLLRRKELELEKCPTTDRSCPKCNYMDIRDLKDLICSSDFAFEVIVNPKLAEGMRRYERHPRVIVSQRPANNFSIDIVLKPYEGLDTCNSPLEEGNCNSEDKKFYYDIDNHQCKEFKYSGCNGNTNNFNSYSECEESCLKEGYCEEGNLLVENNPRNKYSEDWRERQLQYYIGEDCDCQSLIPDPYCKYLVFNSSEAEQTIHLGKDFYFIPLTGYQRGIPISCNSISGPGNNYDNPTTQRSQDNDNKDKNIATTHNSEEEIKDYKETKSTEKYDEESATNTQKDFTTKPNTVTVLNYENTTSREVDVFDDNEVSGFNITNNATDEYENDDTTTDDSLNELYDTATNITTEKQSGFRFWL